jgi:rhomboid protease GluP
MIYRLLVIVNVVIFAVPFLLDLLVGSNSTEQFLTLGSLKGFQTGGFEFYQLATAPFLHAGVIHLAVNMYALGYSIGPDINKVFGDLRFSIIYFFSSLGGSFLSASFQTNLAGSVGASGAIMGLVGALAAFAIKTRQTQLFWSVFWVIILNFWLGFTISGVDNFGHLGGLLTGFVLGYFMITPRLPETKVTHYKPNVIEVEPNNVPNHSSKL